MSATTAGDMTNTDQLTRIEARLDGLQTTTDERFERIEERFEPLERIAQNLETLATLAATGIDLAGRALRGAKWVALALATGALAEVGHLIAGRLLG